MVVVAVATLTADDGDGAAVAGVVVAFAVPSLRTLFTWMMIMMTIDK